MLKEILNNHQTLIQSALQFNDDIVIHEDLVNTGVKMAFLPDFKNQILNLDTNFQKLFLKFLAILENGQRQAKVKMVIQNLTGLSGLNQKYIAFYRLGLINTYTTHNVMSDSESFLKDMLLHLEKKLNQDMIGLGSVMERTLSLHLIFEYCLCLKKELRRLGNANLFPKLLPLLVKSSLTRGKITHFMKLLNEDELMSPFLLRI